MARIRAPSPVTRGCDLCLWGKPQGPCGNSTAAVGRWGGIRSLSRKALPTTGGCPSSYEAEDVLGRREILKIILSTGQDGQGETPVAGVGSFGVPGSAPVTKLWLGKSFGGLISVYSQPFSYCHCSFAVCTEKKTIIIFASSRLLSYITAWQREEGGAGQDERASSYSPRVNLKSRSSAIALNTDISCLLALPKSLLIFLACVYSLDKHRNCDVVYCLLCTHHNPGKTR